MRRFLIVFAALFVLLLDGNLATPLYAVYRERFGFSGTELTLIFATYTVVLIPSLLVFGQLSDRVGRRRVLVGGLAGATLGVLLLALADSTAWLFVARAVQGVALGAVVGTAAAALVEAEPSGDHRRAALAAVLAQSGGSAAGPVVAGSLAEWAPAPRQLCFALAAVATVLIAVAVWRIQEPSRPRGEWRLQRPSVPRDMRTHFARLSLSCGAVWGIGALFLSVVPSYAAALLETRDLALLGAISAGMLAVACAFQTLGQRTRMPPHRALPLGLALLVAGIAALVAAFPTQSLALVLTGAVFAGAGLGLTYFGSQSEINRLAPPERRGEVTAAFITCQYVFVSATAISVGLISDAASLAAAVRAAGIVIALTASLMAAWHVRSARVSP